MRAGKLRHRVVLERKTEARDSYGEAIETWAPFATVWGEKLDGAGLEKILGQQVIGLSGSVWRIRYHDVEPTIADRVKFGTRTFDVNDVTNTDERNREMLLTCTERTD